MGKRLTNKCGHQTTADLAYILGNKPDCRTQLTRNTDAELGIHVGILVSLARSDEIIVNVAALHAVEHVEKECAGCNSRVLEGAET